MMGKKRSGSGGNLAKSSQADFTSRASLLRFGGKRPKKGAKAKRSGYRG